MLTRAVLSTALSFFVLLFVVACSFTPVATLENKTSRAVTLHLLFDAGGLVVAPGTISKPLKYQPSSNDVLIADDQGCKYSYSTSGTWLFDSPQSKQYTVGKFPRAPWRFVLEPNFVVRAFPPSEYVEAGLPDEEITGGGFPAVPGIDCSALD